MAYCKNCGKEIQNGIDFCPYCGARQTAAAMGGNGGGADPATVKALRDIYARYGAQQVLGNSTLLCNAVGDVLGDDGKKLRNQIRMAMEAGLGGLYLKQLQQPSSDFDEKCLKLLTEDAGLSDAAARQLRALFHGMVGFSHPQAGPAPVEMPRYTVPTGNPSGAAPKKKLSPIIPILVVVVVLLAGLVLYFAMNGGSLPFLAKPTATPIPTAVPTAVPTATPTAVPTAVPTTAPTLEPSSWPMLMEDELSYYAATTRLEDMFVLGSQITREQIGSIRFTGSMSDAPADAWDVSADQNGSVKAWVTMGADGRYDLYIAGNGGVQLPSSCAYLFCNYSQVKEIRFNACVSTSRVTDMSKMFFGCESLTSLDVSGFDTSHVTNMNSMFQECSSLTTLDVSGFDTSHVAHLNSMFQSCSGLTSLDVSGFNTSSVTNMGWMFCGCSGLTTLDVSGFDTANVESMGMRAMFQGCSSLTSLDLTNFETSKVTWMANMFRDCSSLTSLDLTSFDTASAVSMEDMFDDCTSLQSIRVSRKFVFPAGGLNKSAMFDNCPAGDVTYE